jgi:hypothetical protein
MEYPDKKKYYYINYKYNFSELDKSDKSDKSDNINQNIINKNKSHPFCEFPYIETESYIGEIICYNEMTEKMIEYLLMPDEELKKVCGATTTQKYRKIIMASLSQFWD